MKKFIRKIANEFLNEEVQNKILINIKNLIPEKNILDTIFKIIPKLHYKYEDLSNSSKNLIRVKKNIIHKLYKDFLKRNNLLHEHAIHKNELENDDSDRKHEHTIHKNESENGDLDRKHTDTIKDIINYHDNELNDLHEKMFKIEEKIEQMNVLQDENEISNLQDIRKELSNLKQKIDLEDSKNIQKFNQFEERLNKLEDECCEKDKKEK